VVAPRPLVSRPLAGAIAALTADGAIAITHVELTGNVTGITLDSRAVQPGDIFAALPGALTHGASHSAQAASRGAVAVFTDPAGRADAEATGLAVIVVDNPRQHLGALSAWTYGNPAAELKIVGITGTNGKTTITYLLEAAFRRLGILTGVIGTTGIHIGDERIDSVRTTPESPDLHAILALMVERGVQVVALEVSSHSLVLGRVDGLRVDVACFTHLSWDHIDFHHDMETYYRAKASLFTSHRATSAVIGTDDSWGTRLAHECVVPFVTVAHQHADWTVTSIAAGSDGLQHVSVNGPSGTLTFDLGLPGDFNVINALEAAACVERLGYDAALAVQAFGDVQVPGRMERIDRGQPFLALVDYAHSPDAIRRVLESVQSTVSGRIIVVLGCGGDRDREKRPSMGAAAVKGADVVIVTDDNPRSEDPTAIRAALMGGINAAGLVRAGDVREIADRALAITTAVELAGPGDVVLLLGKGHEQGQEIAGVIQDFDDRVVLAASLESRP
jgi:UDP-N-acetylmuramoyl-L-alanyl-D-glutamate--2,6-diaminopimelate ligase